MKRFKTSQIYYVFTMLILGVFLITGCGSGGGEVTEHWAPGPTSTLTDIVNPRVTATVPANLAVTAPLNAAITATFTEAMAPTTIESATPTTSTSTFSLKVTAGGANVPGIVTYDVASRTATFKPTAVLTVDINYTATITTAATDVAGNPLAGNQLPLPPAASNYIWTFTASAADGDKPTITLTAPADHATGVALNIGVNATFSEAMDPSTLNTATFTLAPTLTPLALLGGTVTYNPVTRIATFKPTAPLTVDVDYTATITPVAADLAGNTLVSPTVGPPPNSWTFDTIGGALALGAVPLGRAGTFGIMATASTASTGATFINGDVALNPGTSQGIPPAQVNGEIHVHDQVAIDAQTDLTAAYNFAKALASDFPMTPGADQGALYPYNSGLGTGGMPPGVYTSESTMLINTPLTLNAGGNADAVWVFQIGSSLTTYVGSPGGNVLLANGAQAKNVFFVPFAAATIGTNTTFNGSILAGGNITGQTGATINGRMLAGEQGAGAMVLDNNTVNVP